MTDQSPGDELAETLEQTAIADEDSEDETDELEYPAMGMGDHKPKILLMGLKRSINQTIAADTTNTPIPGAGKPQSPMSSCARCCLTRLSILRQPLLSPRRL